MKPVAVAAALCVVGVLGCGGGDAGERPEPVEDAGVRSDSGPCVTNADCDDGVFCNGAETCVAARCVIADGPTCDDGVDCTSDRCVEEESSCAHEAPDADGDGHGDLACEDATGAPVGDDCDDADGERHPGAHEVCDEAGHDEDCDLDTYGYEDEDGDGHNDALCCNTGGRCGDDCDDTRRIVHPRATEACDGFDNECDGETDDVDSAIYLDCDGDGYGRGDGARFGCEAAVLPGTEGCPSPTPVSRWRFEPGDCNDDDATVNPAAVEACDGVDDNCADGVADEAVCPCILGEPDRSCGSDVGACTAGTQRCTTAGWGVCSDVGPGTEVCDPTTVGTARAVDENCDGATDEAMVISTCFVDSDADGYGGAAAGSRCAGSGGSCPVGTVARAGDCNDTARGDINPGAPEVCGALPPTDEDCDGLFDEAGGVRREFLWSTDSATYGDTGTAIPEFWRWGSAAPVAAVHRGTSGVRGDWAFVYDGGSIQSTSVLARSSSGEFRLPYGRTNLNGVVRFDGATGLNGGFDVTVLRLGTARVGPPGQIGLPGDGTGWGFRFYGAEPRMSIERLHAGEGQYSAAPSITLTCRPTGAVRFDATIAPIDATHASVTFELREWPSGRCATSVSYIDARYDTMVNQVVAFGFNAGNADSPGLAQLTLPYYQVVRENTCGP